VKALSGIDFAVQPGELFGLLGPNGAGETTTVKILLGLTHATAGSAALLGRPVSDPESRRPVGYLPEGHRFPGYLTARQTLSIFDAASVGVIHVADLRSRPLAARLFSDTDRIAVDGDAQHFLDEARLNPKEDVDLVVAAGSPKGTGGSDGWGLVLFEGRFDPARLSAALAERGATKKSTPAGDYYLIPDRHADGSGHGSGPAGIAFASARLVIAGSESAVVTALAQRSAGGTGFSSGAGLGRHLNRIDSGASAWALVVVSRIPAKDSAMRRAKVHVSGDDAATAIVSSMKSVQLLALQATAKGDALKLAATGLVSDAETAGLMEDALRGVLAAWRLAAQEKSPDTVSVLRKFTVSRHKDTVSISGTLPGATVRALAEKKHVD
jgi:energy-coupling factor transporter ATP-binding protein EcfA2